MFTLTYLFNFKFVLFECVMKLQVAKNEMWLHLWFACAAMCSLKRHVYTHVVRRKKHLILLAANSAAINNAPRPWNYMHWLSKNLVVYISK